MNLNVWLAFVVAAFLISLSPGAGAISCMASGMRHGYRRTVWNIIGMQFGVALQLIVVGVGLGALLATSTLAFELVKWCGVGYLVYLGWQQFTTEVKPVEIGSGSHSPAKRRALVMQGFLVNASNPKATVFLLAVLPQFIDPGRPTLPQYLVCMATLTCTDLLIMSGYALFASRMLRLLREPRQIRWMNRTFGALYMLAGGFLALFKRA